MMFGEEPTVTISFVSVLLTKLCSNDGLCMIVPGEIHNPPYFSSKKACNKSTRFLIGICYL